MPGVHRLSVSGLSSSCFVVVVDGDDHLPLIFATYCCCGGLFSVTFCDVCVTRFFNNVVVYKPLCYVLAMCLTACHCHHRVLASLKSLYMLLRLCELFLQ